MYIPTHFEMPAEQVRAVLGAAPAGDLVTVGPDGLAATFLPMVHRPEGDGLGSLVGHVARVNDQWRHTGPAMFIVHGPDAYLPADWLATEQGTAVPTWNYVTVQLHGELLAHQEPDWILGSLADLGAAHDDHSADGLPGGAGHPMLRALVGLELRLTSMAGKAKMSQNKSPDVVTQVIEGLHGAGEDPAAAWMAEHSLPRARAKAEQLADLRRGGARRG